MKKLTAILLLTVLFPGTCLALIVDGDELLEFCEGAGNAACSGYVAAIVDAHDTNAIRGDLEVQFCIPKGVKVKQLIKVAVKSFNDHPERLHFTASSLLSNAFYEAFPPDYKDDGTRFCDYLEELYAE